MKNHSKYTSVLLTLLLLFALICVCVLFCRCTSNQDVFENIEHGSNKDGQDTSASNSDSSDTLETSSTKNEATEQGNKENTTSYVVTYSDISTTEPEISESPEIYVDTNPLVGSVEVETTAKSIMIYDIGSDRLIYTTDMNAKIYPASTTKLLTALYALSIADPDEVFTVGDELSFVASDASRAKLKKRQKITFNDLLYAMLLPSGNDAAYVAAANAGRIAASDPKLSAKDAVAYFLDGLNLYIKELGMNDSNFACPDGYHNEMTYTTLHDMMIATKAAMQNELIMQVVATPEISITIESGQQFEWKNSNMLLSGATDKNGEALLECEGVFGLKTGYTDAAGSCLISLARRGDKTVVVLFYNGQSKTGRYFESAALIEYAFDLLNNFTGEEVGKAA